jgi:hypothetical protein
MKTFKQLREWLTRGGADEEKTELPKSKRKEAKTTKKT